MALVKCPECSQQASDQAPSCPHCGFPFSSPSATIAKGAARRKPIFATLALLALAISLFAPRFLLFMPVAAAIGCAIIALFRKERLIAIPWLVILFGVALVVVNSSSPVLENAQTAADLSNAEIVGWNWVPDPTFASDGAIKWNVQVRNKSTKYIDSVEIELTTYDNAGSLVSTTSTFVNAIPPGETRASESFADYYRTEVRANVQIVYLRFAK